MKFEFNTEVDGAKEAAALVSAVAILFGPSVLQAIDAASDRLDERAPDGFPATREELHSAVSDPSVPVVEKDTSAAQAFGGEGAPTTGTLQNLDTAGIPWDERIHSSTKGTNKDGTWSRRRNTPDATYDAVMTELKGGVIPKPPIMSDTILVPPPPPPAPPAPSAENETVVPPPPATSTQAPVSFPLLMVKITKAQTAGKIDAAKVTEFLGMFGLAVVKELASAGADTIAAVNALVDAHVAD